MYNIEHELNDPVSILSYYNKITLTQHFSLRHTAQEENPSKCWFITLQIKRLHKHCKSLSLGKTQHVLLPTITRRAWAVDLKTIKCATATSACCLANLPTLCSVCRLLERRRRVTVGTKNSTESSAGRITRKKQGVWRLNYKMFQISGQHVRLAVVENYKTQTVCCWQLLLLPLLPQSAQPCC